MPVGHEIGREKVGIVKNEKEVEVYIETPLHIHGTMSDDWVSLKTIHSFFQSSAVRCS